MQNRRQSLFAIAAAAALPTLGPGPAAAQDREVEAALGALFFGQPAEFLAALALLQRRDNPDVASVVFKVLVDDEVKLNSGDMGWGDAARKIRVDLTGGSTLSLVVEMGKGIHIRDRANWCDARILRDDS